MYLIFFFCPFNQMVIAMQIAIWPSFHLFIVKRCMRSLITNQHFNKLRHDSAKETLVEEYNNLIFISTCLYESISHIWNRKTVKPFLQTSPFPHYTCVHQQERVSNAQKHGVKLHASIMSFQWKIVLTQSLGKCNFCMANITIVKFSVSIWHNCVAMCILYDVSTISLPLGAFQYIWKFYTTIDVASNSVDYWQHIIKD